MNKEPNSASMTLLSITSILLFTLSVAIITSAIAIPETISNYVSPKTAIIIGIIIILSAIGCIFMVRNQRRTIEKQTNAYINRIGPSKWKHEVYLPIDNGDVDEYLGHGSHQVNYMFVNDQKIINFPEAGLYNQEQYYLIDIKFNAKYSQEFSGVTNSFNNGINSGQSSFQNSYSNSSGQSFGTVSGQSRQVEVPTDALLTFVTTDKQKSFTIRAIKINQKRVNFIQQYFLLNQFEMNKLNLNVK